MSIAARFRVDRGAFVLDVDLTLPGRGVTAVFGPSGGGKSTLLRALAGLDRHRGGRLSVGGEVWQDERTFAPPHRRGVGYVFQEASLFDHLSVAQNVAYGARRAPAARRAFGEERAVALAGIGGLLARRPATLSGGERQRVALARALAAGPRLLLMDEPLAALDATARQEILPCLEALHAELEIPVLYVTHAREEMARLADHLVLLEAGRAAAAGPVAELLTRLDLPLAHAPAAEALLPAVVAGRDDAHHLTLLDSPAGRLSVVADDAVAGRAVRLRIAARDVSLTLAPQEGTSILNILPAVVRELAPTGSAQVTVRLDAGGVPLLARVTGKSAQALGLRPGLAVFAQVKSVAVAG